jgi:hypothetical protein
MVSPVVADEPPLSEGAQEPAVCDVDQLDPVAATGADLHGFGLGLTVRLAHRSFGGAFTGTARNTAREKEGWQ